MSKTKKTKKIKLNIKSLDFVLLATTFILLALGIITVLSASAPRALETSGNSLHYFINQMRFAIFGVFLIFGLTIVDYHKYQKHYFFIYIISIIALLLVVAFGRETNGAKRWIYLGSISIQPSELAKIGLIIFYAGFLSQNKDKIKNIGRGFVIPLCYLVPIVLILYFGQNHLSAAIIMISITIILMFLAGTKIRYFLFIGLPLAGLGALMLVSRGGFRLQRMLTFLDPWANPTGTGWQVVQGQIAIGSGGLFGVGIGQSVQKYLYISEPQNDFIFAIIAEELGFIGCAVVIVLFGVLIWRGLVISMKAPDMFGRLTAAGITAMLALQVIINIGVVTSLLPVTGISLPLFSYGGTSLIIILISIGILLNISRQIDKS